MQPLSFSPEVWRHRHPDQPESYVPTVPQEGSFRPYRYEHQIKLTNVVINRATKYVDNYDLEEWRLTARARKIGTISTKIELSSFSTKIVRRFRYTYANGGVTVKQEEIATGARTLSLHRSLQRSKVFFSATHHLIPDGVLQSSQRHVEPTEIKLTPRFDAISRLERTRTETGNASVHQGQRNAANASTGFTYIGGVGLIPTPLTVAIGAAATVGGIGATAIAQLKGSEDFIMLHEYSKYTPIMAPR